MFEQAFKNIDDVLWKEAGCTTELDYAEQTSWVLFLRYLDDLEKDKAMEAQLTGKPYRQIIEAPYRLSDVLQMPFLPTEVEKYTAIKGDVLICAGSYPGRAAIWNDDEPIYFQKALHRVRFHEPEHNKWFVYFLYAQDKSGELKKHFNGAGIQHFTGEVLARYEIPLPPLAELRRAVAKFDALAAETQRRERIYQQKLAAVVELKKSLLHQAFNGQLT